MLIKITRYLLTLFLLFLSFSATAQKFYIAPSGNDLADGSRENPLATLHAACKMARDYRKLNRPAVPVEIIALSGDYFMMQPLILTEEDSGTKDSPLLIRSEDGNEVTFSGAVSAPRFEKVNDKLWRAFIPQVAWYNSYFEQLYVNGKRAVRARTPNSGFNKVKGVRETVLEQGTGRFPEFAIQKIRFDSSDAACFNGLRREELNDALIVFYHNWDNTRKHITGFSADSSSVFIDGEGMKPWNPINSKSRWYAENFRQALDAPGEWFLERSGYLFYVPEEGQEIENTTFSLPVLHDLVILKGNSAGGRAVSNIQFENLGFGYSCYNTPPSGNEPAQAAYNIEAAITLDYASDISFFNCSIAHTGGYAVWFRRGVSKCTLSQCYLHDLGAGGVKIGETEIPGEADLSNHITVDNNIIRDGGHLFPCAAGIIIFNASDNKITHNEIADLRYTGISAGWVWGYAASPTKRNTIDFNHIHHLGWGELCDMGGVYTLGASEGTTVSNNVIHHIYSFDYGGWGLYTDEGSMGITEENNLVFACKNSGFHQHYGKNNIIRNNILAFNIRAQLQATRIEEHNSFTFTNNIILFDKGSLLSSNWDKINFFSDRNCYIDLRGQEILFGAKTFSQWKKEGKDLHSVIADPGFKDAPGYDFHFKNNKIIRKIGFVPFDYTRAGVYGSENWKKLAEFDKGLAERFDLMTKEREAMHR